MCPLLVLCVLCVSALCFLLVLCSRHSPPATRHFSQFGYFLRPKHPVSPLRHSFHRQRPQSHALHLLHRMPFAKQHVPHFFFFLFPPLATRHSPLLRLPHCHFLPIIHRPPSR